MNSHLAKFDVGSCWVINEIERALESFQLMEAAKDYQNFDDKKNYSAAEKFYNMAFKWDKTSEELYNKLLRILGA